jgi:hypothetical protein
MTESFQLQGQPLRLRLTSHQKSFAMSRGKRFESARRPHIFGLDFTLRLADILRL